MAKHGGRVAWRELVTTSPDEAIDFYCKLFGWSTETWNPDSPTPYRMFKNGDGPFAGIEAITPDDDRRPHWLSYIDVTDVDAAAEYTTKEGGRVLQAPTDIPDVGRFATIADPRGIIASPFKSLNENKDPAKPGDHDFCWDEIVTDKLQVSSKFFRDLFSWEQLDQSMPEGGPYLVFKAGQLAVCGMMELVAGSEAKPHWLSYVQVADVKTGASKAGDLGAKAIVPPTDIPGIGRFAIMIDPCGTAFGLFKSN